MDGNVCMKLSQLVCVSEWTKVRSWLFWDVGCSSVTDVSGQPVSSSFKVGSGVAK
jgi:hypothetical protein